MPRFLEVAWVSHVYNAPGHNDDGLFTIIEPFGLMLSGDYLCDVEPFGKDRSVD